MLFLIAQPTSIPDRYAGYAGATGGGDTKSTTTTRSTALRAAMSDRSAAVF